MNPKSRRAFSLIELIMVIALIALIVTFTAPAVTSLQRSTSLTRGGQSVAGMLALARLTATTKNRAIEVRIYERPALVGGALAYRCMQLYYTQPDGRTILPVGTAITLPEGVIISAVPAFAPILEAEVRKGSETVPAFGTSKVSFRGFRFREDGGTDLDPTGAPGGETWFLMIHAETDLPRGSQPPRNYYLLQIDPITGTTTTFRP